MTKMSQLVSKNNDPIFVLQTFDDDSHCYFVKLFVFIFGDMNGILWDHWNDLIFDDDT